jgi:hypothetical protein
MNKVQSKGLSAAGGPNKGLKFGAPSKVTSNIVKGKTVGKMVKTKKAK